MASVNERFITDARKLPAYHIHTIKKTKNARYHCSNCVMVPKILLELVPNRQRSQPSLKITKEIERLQREISGCESLIKKHQENETDFKRIIKDQKSALLTLKKNLKQDPAFHMLEYIEQNIKTLIDDAERNILHKIENEGKKNESILKEDRERTYAKVVASSTSNNKPKDIAGDVDMLKNAIKSARQEEKTEEKDRKRRSSNFIIHGISETITDNKLQDFVSTLIKDLRANVTINKVKRVGSPRDGKNRPILVFLQNENDKFHLMRSLHFLKGLEKYRYIKITEDLTPDERRRYKELLETAKERNKTSTYVWRVRGSSRSGFVLKKIFKKNINSTDIKYQESKTSINEKEATTTESTKHTNTLFNNDTNSILNK